MLRRINEVLPELILELMLYGLIVHFTGVWFVEDRFQYSTGLWIGIATAMGMAIHIGVVLQDAVAEAMMGVPAQEGENNEDVANKRIIRFSVLRYIAVVIVFFVVAIFHLGNIITCFIGVMGLKASAYLQPFTHKCIRNVKRIFKSAESTDLE